MRHVVERCLTCGVEHEVRVDGCEACGGALRYWCRVHSHEIGWLESSDCRGCAGEKARPIPLPRPVPARSTAVAGAAPAPGASLPPSPFAPARGTPRRTHRIGAPKRPPLQSREIQALLLMLATMIIGLVLISRTGQQNTVASEIGVKFVIVLGILIGVARLFIGRSGE
jgi:hypothetical protein